MTYIVLLSRLLFAFLDLFALLVEAWRLPLGVGIAGVFALEAQVLALPPHLFLVIEHVFPGAINLHLALQRIDPHLKFSTAHATVQFRRVHRPLNLDLDAHAVAALGAVED